MSSNQVVVKGEEDSIEQQSKGDEPKSIGLNDAREEQTKLSFAKSDEKEKNSC